MPVSLFLEGASPLNANNPTLTTRASSTSKQAPSGPEKSAQRRNCGTYALGMASIAGKGLFSSCVYGPSFASFSWHPGMGKYAPSVNGVLPNISLLIQTSRWTWQKVQWIISILTKDGSGRSEKCSKHTPGRDNLWYVLMKVSIYQLNLAEHSIACYFLNS